MRVPALALLVLLGASPALGQGRFAVPSAAARARHARSAVSPSEPLEHRPLRWAAERGNRGHPPPSNTEEWLAFHGEVPSEHLARIRSPEVAIPVRQFGVRTGEQRGESEAVSVDEVANELARRGADRAIARRAARHVVLGLPSQADRSTHEDYLLARNDLVIGYNDRLRAANWLSWFTSREHLGRTKRSDVTWRADPSLPRSFVPASFGDYAGIGYHPGHMLPSSERTASMRANERTYTMANIFAQIGNSNTGPWLDLERYYYELVAKAGFTAHVIAGGTFGLEPLRIGSAQIAVPRSLWKIVSLLEPGQERFEVNTRVIAIDIPNNALDVPSPDVSFEQFITSPLDIEAQTGLRFFTHQARDVADALRTRVDDGRRE